MIAIHNKTFFFLQMVIQRLNIFTESSFLVVILFLHPQSKGYVKLATTDPLQKPLINPRFLSNAYDVDILLKRTYSVHVTFTVIFPLFQIVNVIPTDASNTNL